MGFFTIIRAVFVRLLFTCHGIISIWRVYMVTEDPNSWYIMFALVGLLAEATLTIVKRSGNEWKWFCPSVFFFLMCAIPAVWCLELHELHRRIQLRDRFNATATFGVPFSHNASDSEDLSAKIAGLGLEIRIPLKLSSDQWVRTLEQALLLFLIIGRWFLPKGKLTHDQLSQLLLVYIGTAADIVEFFEAFKEEQVMYNRALCTVILSIWSWSLMQFTMVLTATKARRDQSGVVGDSSGNDDSQEPCFNPDVFGIIISIMMQDGPFLVLRMLLIFRYGVLSYTNMFFTCKNSLVISLLLYRLIMVQVEQRQTLKKKQNYQTMSSSGSGIKLVSNSCNSHSLYSIGSTRKSYQREKEKEDTIPEVKVTLRRHLSFDEMGRNISRNTLTSSFDISDDNDGIPQSIV